MEGQYSTSFFPTTTTSTSRPKQSTTGTASAAASEPTQPWTATRCHRLLRPLLAHIAALRKDKERKALISNGHSSTGSGQTTKPRRTVLGKRSYPADDSDYDDKKPCRKYSRKGSRRRSSSDQACTPQRNVQKQRRQSANQTSQDVVLLTPFLRRVSNHQPSSPAQAPEKPCQEEPGPASRCNHWEPGCKTKCAFKLELKSFRPTMDAEKHGLYESVFKSFDAILRVTCSQMHQAAGPKSLLAMCLRKVPAYIAGREEWEREESEENGTKSAVRGAGVSFEIYSQLESLGAVDGWRNLCLLVQAHAVEIIQGAAAEGLFDDPVTDLLIRLCHDYMPPTEFKSLIDTFVIRQYPKPHSADDDLFASPGLHPLRVLRDCDPSGNSILPRILADLLADGLLPADWVLNKSFTALWPATIAQITRVRPCQGAVDLVIVTLELLCGLASPKKPRGVPQTRLKGKPQTTLISAIAALGSVIALVDTGTHKSEYTKPQSATRVATLRRRVGHIVTTCTSNLKRRKSPGRKLGTYLLTLCSLLSLAEPSSSISAAIENSWKGVRNCRGSPDLMLQYDATTALMGAMAHFISRGTGYMPQIHLGMFCDVLETLALPAGAMSSMHADAALHVFEHSGNLRDLSIAEGLAEEAKRGEPCAGTPYQTPGKDEKKKKASSFSGQRWDDVISEWVAATPGSEMRPGGPRLRSRGAVDSDDDVEMEDDETASEAESETEPEAEAEAESEPSNEVDPVSSPDNEDDAVSSPDDDENDDSSSSETEDEPDAETETDTLSPNTEASPVSLTNLSQMEPTPNSPHPAANHHSPANEPIRKPNNSPPEPPHPPKRGFLAARPRRLLPSRPITRAAGADDELALGGYTNHPTATTKQGVPLGGKEENGKGEENWLGRKKPARFRAGGSHYGYGRGQSSGGGRGGGTGGVGVGAGAAAGGAGRKRVARASLVYLLQPTRGVEQGGRGSVGGGYDGGEGDSGDELSFI